MEQMNENYLALQLFEGKQVRVAWDEEQKKYSRDPKLNSKWGTICTPVEMLSPNSKHRKTQVDDLEGIFRISQSFSSKKEEPVKLWLAEIGHQRILRKRVA